MFIGDLMKYVKPLFLLQLLNKEVKNEGFNTKLGKGESN
jgi:hypothetical protein